MTLLSEMTEKMEELVLEKATLEKEKAKVQDVLLNLDNLRGKKEDVAKVCTKLWYFVTKIVLT